MTTSHHPLREPLRQQELWATTEITADLWPSRAFEDRCPRWDTDVDNIRRLVLECVMHGRVDCLLQGPTWGNVGPIRSQLPFGVTISAPELFRLGKLPRRVGRRPKCSRYFR